MGGNGVLACLLFHISSFLDDTSFMGQARLKEATSFRNVLDMYLVASRKKVNEKKSSIFFFNTP